MSAPTPSSDKSIASNRILIGCLVVVVLPVLGGLARATLAEWAPVGDTAAIELRAFDTFTSRTPLVGMPSTALDGNRETLHHPGPLHFWALAVPTRLVSAVTDDAASLAVAQSLLNTTLLSVGVIVLWRVRRRPAEVVLASVAVSLALWVAGSPVAYSPWNPDAALVALIALACTVAAGRDGDTGVGRGVFLATTFSLAAQPHVVYAVPAVVLFGVGLVPYVRASRTARSARPVAPVALGIVVCWIGPLIDAVLHGGGNLLAFTGSTGEDRFGFSRAFDRLTASVLPWRLGLRRGAGGVDLVEPVLWVDRLVALTMIGVLVVLALRSPMRRAARVVLGLLLALLVFTTMTPRTLATVFGGHLHRAWIVPVVLTWGVLVVAGVRRLGSTGGWSGRTTRSALLVGAAGGAVLAVVPLSGTATTFNHELPCATAVRSLSSAVADPAQRTMLLDSDRIALNTFSFESQVVAGLYADLVRRGADARMLATVQPGMIQPDRLVGPEAWKSVESILTVTTDDGAPAPTSVELASAVGGESCDAPGQRVTIRLWETRVAG